MTGWGDLEVRESEILVSVVCLSYNHKKYIKKSLDSIVGQTLSVPFEIIVHDDASTDGTTEIVREYANKYPNVTAIIEQENCYQNGIDFYPIISSRIHGKYVALCECDDWWCSTDKLQQQFDYMENNPDCSLCVHGVKRFDWSSDRYLSPISPSPVERDFSTEEIIEGDGGLFGTNSMFFRANNYLLPDVFNDWGVGDYPRTIYLSTLGRVHYSPKLMSVYQVFSEGSWSSKMRDADFHQKQEEEILRGLRRFDEITCHRYRESIEIRQAVGQLEYSAKFDKRSCLRNAKTIECLKTVSKRQRMVYLLRIISPSLYQAIKKLKDHISSVHKRGDSR